MLYTQTSAYIKYCIPEIKFPNILYTPKPWLFLTGAVLCVDCSQSPIFSWDRLDIPRLLTVTAILILKCTEGAGVGDYGWGGGKGEKNRGTVYFSRFLPNRPRPLGSFDTHARWVARNAKLSVSMILRKNRRLWTVYPLWDCGQGKQYALRRGLMQKHNQRWTIAEKCT